MVTVGVLVRAGTGRLAEVERRLIALDSVTQTIALEEPGSLGLVLQGPDLNAVHAALTEEVQRTEGVLAAWPLHTELGSASGEARATQSAGGDAPTGDSSGDTDPTRQPPTRSR